MATKRYQIENMTRAVHLIPAEAGKLRDANGLFVLGDRVDTDDNVPEGLTRDPARQPAPTRIVSETDLVQLGEIGRFYLDDQIAQGRIRKIELAAGA